jgi:DNA (cytosine-5)-methyltransferase 1
VEWDAYATSVLVARQNDGTLPPFPIWDDVQTFDGRPWRGRVDVVSGGFPCTDISAAGRGAGIDGEASGMWRHMARIVGEVRPRHVLVENSPMLVRRGLARVLGDLAALGYDARWGVLGAAHAGAPHQRDRIWIVATDADGDSQHAVSVNAEVAAPSEHATDADGSQRERDERTIRGTAKRTDLGVTGWWEAEPDVGRVAHGVANRVDRLRCIGNGQVPEVVRLAWRTLTND